MNENSGMEIKERERIVEIIVEGRKSDYWKILCGQIEAWIDEEKSLLAKFNRRGLKPEDLEKYNRAVERMDYLYRFLTINESIADHNRSLLDRLKILTEKSFVSAKEILSRSGFLTGFQLKGEGNENGSRNNG